MKKTSQKTLLIYPPYCTPASPPYSITNLYSYLKANLPSNYSVSALDLNIVLHTLAFSKYNKLFKDVLSDFNFKKYEAISKQFLDESKRYHSLNNKKIVEGKKPEFFDELFSKIIEEKPDIVAISVVYSSQSFYAMAIAKELKLKGIDVVIGGPAANSLLEKISNKYLEDEFELYEYITNEKPIIDKIKKVALDFSIYDFEKYFTTQMMLPIKSSNSCYYKKCTFCTHHAGRKYIEYDLDSIKKTIQLSKQRNFLFIDDMIHKKRLLEIADALRPLKINWMCQLKPTKDLDFETLNMLYESGLKAVIWGIESGCDRVLDLMKKGTNKTAIERVLSDSKKAGIINATFILFGFPGETKEEFYETILFLKENSANIDLISTSIFGLQKGSPIYNDPKSFGIKITETKRTILEPKIAYEFLDEDSFNSAALLTKDALSLRKKEKQTFLRINKFPSKMNFFREHMMLIKTPKHNDKKTD